MKLLRGERGYYGILFDSGRFLGCIRIDGKTYWLLRGEE